MKKKMIILSMLLISSTLFSKTLINYNKTKYHEINNIMYISSTNKPFTGKLNIYAYNSKRIIGNAEFKNGKRDGETNYYYYSGNSKYSSEIYKNGKREGKMFLYNHSGKKRFGVIYKNDKIISNIHIKQSKIKKTPKIKEVIIDNNLPILPIKLSSKEKKFSKIHKKNFK